MMQQPIHALVFDLFGTLVDNYEISWCHEVLTRMASTLHVPPEKFILHWTVTSWEARARGVFASIEESILAVCHFCGVVPSMTECEQATEMWLLATEHVLIPRRGVLDLLSHLGGQGFRIGIVTDCALEVALRWPANPLSHQAHASVLSCMVGYKKPEVGMYQMVCDQLRIAPGNCLYIGDGCGNELWGAREAGMYPIWLEQDEHETLRPDRVRTWEPSIHSLNELVILLQ